MWEIYGTGIKIRMWDKKRVIKPLLWDISKLMLPLKVVANYQNLSWKKKYLGSQNKKLSENIFGKLHRYYMVHFGLLLSCYSVHKGQSGSYVGFFLQFYLILHDFSFLVILDCILVEHIVMKQG